MLVAALVATGIGLLLGGGGGGGGKAPIAATPSPSASPSPFPPLARGTDPRLAVKPTVRVPSAAPRTLRTRDLVVGTGPAVRPGQQLTVNYVGVGYPGGAEFDSSWRVRKPFTFVLGQGRVIAGWDRGLVGMRVGGRRELVVPAALGYGAKGAPPSIRPNEPLVFVVDLLSAT